MGEGTLKHAIVAMIEATAAFTKPKAQVGLQEETIGKTKVWVLPNPSGLNAHYQAKELVAVFRKLGAAVK